MKVELNGLTIRIGERTGCITRLDYPGAGTLLKAEADRSSILDVAQPIEAFEPLRLAARFSDCAELSRTDGGVRIHWERLGASRSVFAPAGPVSASVDLKSAADGRSVVMSAEIHNQSDRPIRQVIFPDFMGALPFAGLPGTRFRTTQDLCTPFVDLRDDEYAGFYATRPTYAEYRWSRWMDLGGYRGGMSLFAKRWGWDPFAVFALHLCASGDALRIMCLHDVTVEPEQTWRSGDFVLTPHEAGWAKGIEPYRDWIRQNIRREYPLPKHIRDGLGARTVFMSRNYPADPKDAIWRFKDLPRIAREAARHGLCELNLWSWHDYFKVPFPPAHEHLGGEKALAAAARECRKIGVRISPFVSVASLDTETAARYGLTVAPPSEGWTSHPELIPPFRANYAYKLSCSWHPVGSADYVGAILKSWKRLIDLGITCLAWDQYVMELPEPNFLTMAATGRAMAKKQDPEASFSGEEYQNYELGCDQLDYTWNWRPHSEAVQPLVSAFPVPRRNTSVNTSARQVKLSFADNLFINVMPPRGGDSNGSDWIANHPDLSAALRQCARLRRKFLRYFVGGTFIGDCILSRACRDAHVASYVLPKKVLVIVVNKAQRRAVKLACNVSAWLASRSGKYEATLHNDAGKPLRSVSIGRSRPLVTHSLGAWEIAALEIVPR